MNTKEWHVDFWTHLHTVVLIGGLAFLISQTAFGASADPDAAVSTCAASHEIVNDQPTPEKKDGNGPAVPAETTESRVRIGGVVGLLIGIFSSADKTDSPEEQKSLVASK